MPCTVGSCRLAWTPTRFRPSNDWSPNRRPPGLTRRGLRADSHGYGEITTLGGFGIDVLPFEDPDGVQLELTAPQRRADPGE